jgi:hypothetical protein
LLPALLPAFPLQSVWNKGESMYSGIDHRPEALRSLLKKFGFRLHEVMDAQDISRRYHPHVQGWNPIKPHVAPFFGYVAAEKVRYCVPGALWFACMQSVHLNLTWLPSLATLRLRR